MTQERYLQAIQSLEPVFFEAGKLAVKLQKDIVPKTKLGTGLPDIDIVTDADTAVQETILAAASKTILSQCRLVAEEKTPSVDQFNPNGEFLFTVDPIDGTSRYAVGAPIYSLIVSLQRPGLPVYTFIHFPALGWTHRFAGLTHREDGQKPNLTIQKTKKVIAYSYGNPAEKIPHSIRQEMEHRGFRFVVKEELTPECGAGALFLAGAVQGYYAGDPQAVDGLVCLHYALAHNCEIHRGFAENWPEPGLGGMRYPGHYFVIRQ